MKLLIFLSVELTNDEVLDLAPSGKAGLNVDSLLTVTSKIWLSETYDRCHF